MKKVEVKKKEERIEIKTHLYRIAVHASKSHIDSIYNNN